MPDREGEAIAGVNVPTTRKQLKRFLGKAGFCRIWILTFGLIVKPLYEALKRSVNEPLNWTAECLESFHTIKEKISTAPALGLPDIRKPFDLFVHEDSVSLGVLTQSGECCQKASSLLFNQLDTVSQGWPVCFGLWLRPVTFYRKLKSSPRAVLPVCTPRTVCSLYLNERADVCFLQRG